MYILLLVVLILFSIVVSTLLWADLGNRYVWVVVLVTLAMGLIGWIDDLADFSENLAIRSRLLLAR